MTQMDFRDEHATDCHLRVTRHDDGTVDIYGWNYGADDFTAIDLSPTAARKLAAFLAGGNQ